MRSGLFMLAIGCAAGAIAWSAPPAANAADFGEWSGLQDTAGRLGYNLEGETDPAVVAGRILQYFISLLGIIFLIIIAISYIIMSNAGGNEDKVVQGKQWLKHGIWGMLIIFAAYLLVSALLYMASGSIFGLGG